MLHERFQQAAHTLDLADEKARHVDDMGTDITERPCPRPARLEAPGERSTWFQSPILQIISPEAQYAAQLAHGDQFPSICDRRSLPVVVAHHRLDTSLLGCVDHLASLRSGSGQRFLAQD